MNARIQLPLKAWTVPNFVVVDSNSTEQPLAIPLRECDPLTLAQMCDHFRQAVFAKAEQDDPA